MATVKQSAKANPLAAILADPELVAALKEALGVSESEAEPEEEGNFTADDVREQDWEFWFNLKEAMIERNSDGSPKTRIGKQGGTVVVVKKGLDYGVYRFIKGIARNIRPMDGKATPKLTDKQVKALVKVVNRPNMAELIQTEEPETQVEKPKKGRPAKK